MPKRDITFEIIRLLSQQIVSDKEKYPEGPLMQKTACMNPEDAEIIGFLEAAKEFVDDSETLRWLDKVENFFEKIGLSRWVKGELTHLGLRAGLKYHETLDLAEDLAVDEVDVASGEDAAA